MNIAVVSMIHEPWGGSEELWSAAVKIALQNGHQIIHSSAVNGKNHPKIKALLDAGMHQIVRKQYVPDNKPLIIRAVIKRLYFLKEFFINRFSHLDQYKIDAVLYVGTAYSISKDFDLIKWTKQQNIPLFINCQLNFEAQVQLSNSQKLKITTAFEQADKILFVSERNKEVAFSQLGKSFGNAAVIRNPVNMASIDYLPFPNAQEPFQMAMVGNLVTSHKGQDLMLQALANDKWKQQQWQLNIYGAGPDEQRLKQLTQSLQLQHKTTFHGRVADIRSIWQKNHILLMPSHMEGMPLALVEAMICGRPSVVTDVGGHTEWITDGKEGFIARSPSVDALEKKMDICWGQKQHWEQMGKAAHEKALQLYDPKAGETLLNLLTQKKS
ncbi:MAG: glycosyltransferase, partial [Ferruginibacter sp.]